MEWLSRKAQAQPSQPAAAHQAANDGGISAEFVAAHHRHFSYCRWATWPISDEQPREGGGAHGPWVKTYANSVAAQAPGGLPYGSILVNEEYDDDAKTLLAVPA